MWIKDIRDYILYEDRDILVCHKPAGIAVQSARVGSMDMESMLKNYIVLFLLNSLLGLNTFTDAKDIYYSIVGVFPFLESDFLKNGMFIILWIVLSFSEVYIIKVYTNLFILRMNKNKMMK